MNEDYPAPQSRQLILDLGHRPAFGRADFLVSSENRDAVDWIDRWPAWPGHCLAIYGPPGCGKSHLAHVFALRAQARVVDAASVILDAVPGLTENKLPLVIENAENVSDERALLHLFNAGKEEGGSLLFTSRNAPARWEIVLPDLKSRVAAVPAVAIAPPGDEMMGAVLVKLFADRQLAVGPDVIAYIVSHMDRTFAAARQIAARADAEALAGGRAVTIPLVKALIEI